MTKSTVTTERLREIIERRSPSLRWGEAEKVAAELLAVREAQPVKFALSTLDGRIQTNKESVFNSQQGAERVLSALSKALATKINLKIVPLYATPPAPALPDDTRRMDWLVAHHVEVRKPLLYGSEKFFTAQTLTDEEDDYHATSLREQIDAAMAAAPTPTKAVNHGND
ncbi:hypothetical protein [Serratia fonticola]|uniref:hypothetical protein n=1 Tax=Serratia fonticola TaxID=47917 RepID=UPI003AAE4CD9